MPVLLAAAVLLQVQFRDDPKDWKLLKTAHFDVHYPGDAFEPRARDFAAWFEDARIRNAKTTGVMLEERIQVFVFKSFHDLSQCSFLGQPRTEMEILGRPRELLREPRSGPEPGCRTTRSRAFAFAEPTRNRIFIHCQASDRWNAWFVRHELAHQIQYQEIFPWRLPSLLIPLKDPLIPQWFWEGFADYAANIFDSAKDEWVRDLAEEHLYDLKEYFQGDALDNHDYLAVYYQGSMFFKYLHEKIADTVPARFLRAYGSSFPLPMSAILRKTTNRERPDLEKGFKDWLDARYAPMMKDRTRPETRVTDTREHYRRRTRAGRYSPDGKHVAWISDRDVAPDVYVDGAGQLGLRRGGISIEGIHSAPSWSPDGSKLVVAGWWHHHDYLYFIDLNDGVTRVRPEFEEVTDPDWSPDGQSVVFAGLKDGTSDLWSWKIADGSVTRITNDREGDFDPTWSPDGKSIAFIHEAPDGRTELTILNVADGSRRAVGNTLALLDSPRWAPNGRSVVVSADVDGVYDAFAIDVATGAPSRLTRFRGGVHEPDVSPDGTTLLFTYVESHGSDLWSTPYRPQEETRFAQEDRKGWYEQFTRPAPVKAEPAEHSRKFGVDFFMAPVTSASFLVPGLDLRMSDLEGENAVTVQGFGFSKGFWQAGAIYANTRWHPTWGVGVLGGGAGDLRTVGGGPFIAIPDIISQFGWTFRDTHEYDPDRNDEHLYDSGPNAGFLFTTQTRTQPRDPSWGVALSGSGTFFRDEFGGDRNLTEYASKFETQVALAQDVLLWTQATFEKKSGRLFFEDELLGIEGAVRGAKDFDGTDRGRWTVELRFPIVRDLFWMPFEVVGLGEYALIKDLRGFLFADAGYVGIGNDDLDKGPGRAISAGAGIRIDLFGMAWPVENVRGPLRLEFWGGVVGMEGEKPDFEGGAGFTLGY